MATERDLTIVIKGKPDEALRALGAVQSRMTQLDSATKKANDSWKRMRSSMIAGLGAFVGFKTIQMVGKFDDGIRRVGVNAGMTASEMLNLKQQTLNASLATGAGSDDLSAMAKGFLDTNKNVGFYMDNLKYMASLQAATGASGEELGKSLGEMQREGNLSTEAFQTMTASMAKFASSKYSKMSFAEMIPSAGDLMDTIKTLYGRNATTKQIQDFMTTAMFTGSPAAFAKAMKKMALDPKVKPMLQRIGATASEPINVIIAKAKAAGATVQGIAQMFGLRVTPALIDLVNDTKEWNEALEAGKGTAADVARMAETAAGGFGGAMKRLNTVWLQVADKAFAPAIDALAASLGSISPEDWQAVADSFKAVGDVLSTSLKGWVALLDWLKAESDAAKKADENRRREQKQAEEIAMRHWEGGKPGQLPGRGTPSTYDIPTEPATRSPLEAMGVTTATQEGAQATANAIFSGSEGQRPIRVETTNNFNVDGDRIAQAIKSFDIVPGPEQMVNK